METKFKLRRSKVSDIGTITFSFNSYNGKRIRETSKIKIEEKNWDFEKDFPKDGVKEVRRIFENCVNYRKVMDRFIETFIDDNERLPNKEELQDKIGFLLDGKKPTKKEQTLLQELRDKFYEEFTAANKKETESLAQKKKHITHFFSFLKPSPTIADLTSEVVSRYTKFIKVDLQGYEISTLNNYRKNIVSFLNWLKKNKHTEFSLSADYPVIKEKTKTVHSLTKNEMEVLKNIDHLPEHMSKQVDIFLFLCYTGWDISTTALFTKACIDNGIVTNYRKKNGNKQRKVVNDDMQRILDKYSYELPLISPNKGNKNLKQAFKILGLNRMVNVETETLAGGFIVTPTPLHEIVSWHLARKTSCSTNGAELTIPVAMAISGHVDVKVFMKHYVNITDDDLKEQEQNRSKATPPTPEPTPAPQIKQVDFAPVMTVVKRQA